MSGWLQSMANSQQQSQDRSAVDFVSWYTGQYWTIRTAHVGSSASAVDSELWARVPVRDAKSRKTIPNSLCILSNFNPLSGM